MAAGTPFPDGALNLFVTEIGEPHAGSLRVVVGEAIPGAPEAIVWDGIDLGEGRPLRLTDSSRHFELRWDHYVAYAVRNESYWKAESGEPPFERHLNRRTESAFLTFVSATTFADDDYPGPLEHWALSTLTHCVDVVSVGAPDCRLLPPRG